jgi:hypothetical protein
VPVRHTYDKMASQLDCAIPTPGGAIPTPDGAIPTPGLTTPTPKRGLERDSADADKDGVSQSGESDKGYDSEATEDAPARPPNVKKQRVEEKKAQKKTAARPTLVDVTKDADETLPVYAWARVRKAVGVFPGLTKGQWMGMPRDARQAANELSALYSALRSELRSEAATRDRTLKDIDEFMCRHKPAEGEKYEPVPLQAMLQKCMDAEKLAKLKASAALCLYKAAEAAYFENGGLAFKTEL